MYPQFDSIADAKNAYRRCRTTKHFILSDAGAAELDPICARCGKRLSEDIAEPGYRGNRCMYRSKDKKVIVLHYLCAWENVFGAVFNHERLL